jgi:hypothetical protein
MMTPVEVNLSYAIVCVVVIFLIAELLISRGCCKSGARESERINKEWENTLKFDLAYQRMLCEDRLQVCIICSEQIKEQPCKMLKDRRRWVYFHPGICYSHGTHLWGHGHKIDMENFRLRLDCTCSFCQSNRSQIAARINMC